MRKLFVGFSASALFLAPIAIVLVIYLTFHPLFFSVLENYGDFGILLSILLGSVIIISGTWFVLGLKQYRIISSWNKRHIQYTRIKEDMQKAFASQFEIEEPQILQFLTDTILVPLELSNAQFAWEHIFIWLQNSFTKFNPISSRLIDGKYPFSYGTHFRLYQAFSFKIIQNVFMLFHIQPAKANQGGLSKFTVLYKLQDNVFNDVYLVTVE